MPNPSRYSACAAVVWMVSTVVLVRAAQAPQQPPPPTPPPQTAPAQPPAGGRQGGGRGEGQQQPGTFPAQQRPPGDPGAHRARQVGLFRDLHRLPRRRLARRSAGRPEPAPLARGVERSAGRVDHADRPRQPRRARHAAAADAGRRREGGRRVHPQRAGHVGRQGGPPRNRGAAAGHRSSATPPPVRRTSRRSAAVPLAHRRSAGHRDADSRSEDAADLWVSGGAVGGRGRGAASGGAARKPVTATVTLTVGREGRRPPGADRPFHRDAGARGRHGPQLPARRRHAQGRDQGSAGGSQALLSAATPKKTCTT